MGLFDFLKKATLRRKCSDCGKNGRPIDNMHIKCDTCNQIWDGRAEMTQAIVLVKEANTVIRAI